MDLSKLLGDLYTADDHGDDRSGDGHAATGKERSSSPAGLDTSAGPEWSDETRLDEVFASWTPGPPSDAPAAEREMAYGPRASGDEAELPVDAETEPGDGTTEVSVPVASEAPAWTRSDDDVLPHRRGRRLSLLRR